MIIKVQENNEHAITLIALVITIVIMLILAGITINMGLQGVDEAKDNKFISELDMVNHALLERKTKASLTHEEYPGTPYTDFSEINTIIGEINSQNTEGVTVSLKDTASPENYYLLDKSALKELGITDTEDEYIVNYETGEVINKTQKVTPSGKALYMYSVDNT